MMAHACGIPAALFNMRYPRVPYVLTLQEGDPPKSIERKMFFLWPLFSRAFKKADVVQAISTFLGTWARSRGFVGRLEIIPNAVDVQRFAREYSEHEMHEIKDALGKRMGDVFLITTSRLVRKNAVDDVIRALPLMPHNVRFIILGIGPDEQMLKKLAERLKVTGRVTFLGYIDHSELPKYLKAADIFIRPSRSEGMGNSFVEAMAAGLPVIATQEGGIADFLFDEKRNPGKPITGFAVDVHSPAQIAAAVQDIMEHPEKVRAVIRTAKEMVMHTYDWNSIASDMRRRIFDRLA
jgi:phosphatidylinositol alpha-1,6-mannosyltransferase